jgi:glycosyltransferase involved in cell wall biosynthesis
MLVQSPQVDGPLPKHTPILINALQALGCKIDTSIWGRHTERENLFQKVVGRIQDLFRAVGKLRTHPYDFMIVKTTHNWLALSRDIPLLLLTRQLCPHIVLQLHGSFSDQLVVPGNLLFKLFSHWLVDLSDAILVLSTEEQREWQKFHSKGRFYVTINPFHPDLLEFANSGQPDNGKSGEDPVLLFVGRLMREKGIFDLLNAISNLRVKIPFHMFIVGDGPDSDDAKLETVRMGLGDWVNFTGYLKGKELSDIYRKADVFVFPSWREGFPTVVAEAMGYGLPIVTTRIRGTADHLQEGINTLFVPIKDPASLAKAIASLLNDPNLRIQMGLANRKKVEEFMPNIVGQQYLNILMEIIDG